MFEKRPGSGERIHAAGADGAEAIVGFNDVAIAGEDECALGVGDDEKRFEMAKGAILAPLLGQFDRGFLQIAGMLLQLTFEALEERKGIGGGAGKVCEDFVIVETAGFPGGVLE